MTTRDPRTIAIVGGGLAAASAAKTLRSEGFDGRLAIVADEPVLPYERPPLTKEYLRGEAGREQLLAQPAAFYEQAAIEVLGGRRAVALDAGGRVLTLDDGSTLRFDALLLATGARAVRPALPGIDLPWVHLLRTAADADRLREAARAATSVVVGGGGWIAAEAAASLAQMGLRVTLVVPGAEVLERHLGAAVGRVFTRLHDRHGVRVVRGVRIAGLAEGRGRRVVRLADGSQLATDLVVLGLGAAPAVELAVLAGLEVGDGITVDRHLATAAPGIFAVGDVASAWHPRYERHVRSGHWDTARRQGRTAARNMLGASVAYEAIPYFFSDQYELSMELFGSPADADEVLVRPADDGTIAVWLAAGRAVAAMHANVPSARKALDALVTSGDPVDAGTFRESGLPIEEAVAASA